MIKILTSTQFPAKYSVAAGLTLALTLGLVGLGDARAGSKATAEMVRLELATPADWTQNSLPALLSESDIARYRVIFRQQKIGEWKAADRIIAKLTNRTLMGHVLAQRYLHRTKYRSRYKELKAWMADYADHPEAQRLYKLALRRRPRNWKMPKAPTGLRLNGSGYVGPIARLYYDPQRKLTKAQRREMRGLKRKMFWYSRKGWTKAFKKLIQQKRVARLFHPVGFDRQQGKLAAGYYAAGRDDWALMWATRATRRSGKYLPEAHWVAALASWRLGKFQLSRDHFEAVSNSKYSSPWLITAGAFWAARASLKIRRPQDFNRYLNIASAYPRTFYGLLARRLLGIEPNFNWTPPPLAKEALAELAAAPGGRRAVMLLQVGEDHRAETELRKLFRQASPELAQAMLALADRADMPSLAMRLGNMLVQSGSSLYDSTAYPAPSLGANKGEVLDRELILALIRQESGFNPKAKSKRGARGLMQIMPSTASFVGRDRRLRGSKRHTLFDPAINLSLGQKYIDILMNDKNIDGDLFRMIAAWNAGPGNLRKWTARLNKWGKSVGQADDPLLFIESMPSRETRIFVERVLTNYWIYRYRFNQPLDSLEAVARGEWPTYRSDRAAASQLAQE